MKPELVPATCSFAHEFRLIRHGLRPSAANRLHQPQENHSSIRNGMAERHVLPRFLIPLQFRFLAKKALVLVPARHFNTIQALTETQCAKGHSRPPQRNMQPGVQVSISISSENGSFS